MTLNKIIFAAGGTGGHIYPAIAVADELKKMNDKIDILFIGVKGKMEEKVIPQYGYQLRTINISGLNRNLSPKNLLTAFKFFSSTRAAANLLRTFEPDIVFGTGGYVSGPVFWAANRLKIPSVIYEGNFYPGLTVRLFASRVNKILLNFTESTVFFKQKDKINIMPYPVRRNLKTYSRNGALSRFGLNPGKKTLFIFGGSQGAHSINRAILNCLDKLVAANIQMLWQTGENDYDVIKKTVGENLNIKLFSFLNEIDYAYSASDLVVCRSGISAVMEIAYFGIPVIFVPYPFSSEAHQLRNAERLKEQNAAEMILDKDLQNQLATKVIELINDESKLKHLRHNIRQFCDPKAASRIAGFLKDFMLSKN